MKKLLILFTFISCLLSNGLESINSREYKNVIKSEGLVVVDFFSLKCGPCRQFFSTLHSVAQKNTDVGFYKLSVEDARGSSLRHSLGIKMIPTLIFYKDGKEVHRVVGRLPENDLMELIKNYKA